MEKRILEADLTWTGSAFEPGVQVVVDPAGAIGEVGRLDLAPTLRLHRQALLPGMVNAHSHAFQRGLRGLGERYPGGASSFWNWRREMYELVEELDGERFFALTRRAYGEMLAAGITTVGEFHYLHHGPHGGEWVFDELVLKAARATGIRLVLLNAFYGAGGIGQPLRGAQKRFATPDESAYWRQLDRLAAAAAPATQQVGVVAHSVRAVGPEQIADLWHEARRRDLPFHIHLEEQQREIEECRQAFGETPLELLSSRINLGDGFTAVHCTHSGREALTRLLTAGGRVCLCPTTEANLGDGIADLPTMLEASGRLCLGTDSNCRISMTEEMRWLEHVQRLAHERRGVVRDADGDCAAGLFRIATEGGAGSLGIETGRIAPGCPADLVALDLEDPVLAGCTAESLLAGFVFGGADSAIVRVMVGGRWVDPPRP